MIVIEVLEGIFKDGIKEGEIGVEDEDTLVYGET